MEYIFAEYSVQDLLLCGFIIAIGGILALSFFAVLAATFDRSLFWKAACGVAGFAVVAAVIICGIRAVAVSQSVADDRVAAAKDRYGVELSDRQVNDLKFPDKQPASPGVFGKTEVTEVDHGKLVVQTLKLVWDGNRLLLMGQDGDDWTELPVVG